MGNQERFITLCKGIRCPGIEKLITWLEESDFFKAPASTRFHGAYAGGLLEHSLNVYDELRRLLSIYPQIKISDESVLICSLFHDLCKVDMYDIEKRNRKNSEGKWESYDTYTINQKFNYGGHGSKSVFLIQHFMDLTPEEAVAINCHMSAFTDDWKFVGGAFEQFPFAWLVSVADQSATYIVENNNIQKG